MCSQNKGADQLRSYCETELCLCFCIYADCWFSHDATQMFYLQYYLYKYNSSKKSINCGYFRCTLGMTGHNLGQSLLYSSLT